MHESEIRQIVSNGIHDILATEPEEFLDDFKLSDLDMDSFDALELFMFIEEQCDCSLLDDIDFEGLTFGGLITAIIKAKAH